MKRTSLVSLCEIAAPHDKKRNFYHALSCHIRKINHATKTRFVWTGRDEQIKKLYKMYNSKGGLTTKKVKRVLHQPITSTFVKTPIKKGKTYYVVSKTQIVDIILFFLLGLTLALIGYMLAYITYTM